MISDVAGRLLFRNWKHMKPNKPAMIKPQGTATPTPIATAWSEGAGRDVGVMEDAVEEAADEIRVLVVEGRVATELAGPGPVVEVVVVEVVGEDVVWLVEVVELLELTELVVAGPITPIVVRAEGVPASPVRT